MRPDALFPSRLGATFTHLDPKVQWVHGGASRELIGTVTVQRGHSLVAKILAALTSLPPTLVDAPIEVRIAVAGEQEQWIRTFAGRHEMSSRLYRKGTFLVERLGPSTLTFLLTARAGGMDWQLQKISMLGVPLPVGLFEVSARVDAQEGRYHFLIDSALRGVGRIVRYEGLLDARP